MDLTALRAELDGIDDALHDLLMRRAAVVQQVAHRKAAAPTASPLRPGREAAILRRLLARHRGALPDVTIVRIWRELLAGSVAMQGPFCIAVASDALVAVAREQFGALTPLQVTQDSVAAVREGRASIAVLPQPDRAPDSGADAWWVALTENGLPRVHVVGRLPFWSPRPPGSPVEGALVVGPAPPDPSGADRTLVAIAGEGDVAHALAQAGPWRLIELDGFLAADDPRIAALTGNACIIGAYACPAG